MGHAAVGPGHVTGRRVLVIDDHAGFRATARRMLEAEGWVVVGEAGDGAAAMMSAARLRPDVILLDIGLPDIDGFDLAERLAASDATVRGRRRPAIVLVSSRSRAVYAGRLRESQVVGFIGKDEIDGQTLAALLGGAAS